MGYRTDYYFQIRLSTKKKRSKKSAQKGNKQNLFLGFCFTYDDITTLEFRTI